MNSLPSTDHHVLQAENEKQYWQVLAQLDPELYRIRIALEETKLNPNILPRIIRSIANLAYGTGFGKVQIFMQQRIVTQIKPEESDNINLSAVEEE